MEHQVMENPVEGEAAQPNIPVGEPSFTVTSKLYTIAIRGQGAVESSRTPALIIAIGGIVVQILGLGLIGWALYQGGPELLRLLGPVISKVIGH
jgi:hypothetical protein